MGGAAASVASPPYTLCRRGRRERNGSQYTPVSRCCQAVETGQNGRRGPRVGTYRPRPYRPVRSRWAVLAAILGAEPCRTVAYQGEGGYQAAPPLVRPAGEVPFSVI